MLSDDPDSAELRILLVEDDDDDAFLFERAVESSPHQIHLARARHGREGVAHMEGIGADARPELIVLDLNMPVMNGQEFLAWLRRDPRYEDVQVIVLTTSREDAVLEQARQLGADAALSKDMGNDDVEDLRQMIVDFWFHGSVRRFDPDENSPL